MNVSKQGTNLNIKSKKHEHEQCFLHIQFEQCHSELAFLKVIYFGIVKYHKIS